MKKFDGKETTLKDKWGGMAEVMREKVRKSG